MVLTDEQWAALKSALDAVRPGTGRPLADERRTVEGVVWRLRNGARWRALPAEFGPWWRAAQLHIRWSAAGLWERLFARLRDAGRPELADVLMDGTVIRAHQKAAGARGGRRGHALGRSRGGFSTKACAACDAAGRPLAFALLPGQAAELRAAPALLAAVAALGIVLRVICDQAYSSAAWRALIAALGAEPVVPAHPRHKSAPPHDPVAYRRRHKVENLWARLKEWRAVATRYEKTAASYLGDLHLAGAFEWLAVP
jgi:transposase